MTRPAGIGIIGAGWWAAANHILALKALPDCEIVAVNRLGARAVAEIQSAFGIAKGFEDYRETPSRTAGRVDPSRSQLDRL